MPYPTKYTRQYDFQSYHVSNPTRPLPGGKVNVDLNAVVTSVDEIVEFLKTSIRSDGRLANGSVGVNQLDATFDLGFSLPTMWEPNVDYTTDSTVLHDNRFYKANVAHRSTDGFDESKWGLIVDFGAEADAAATSAMNAATSEMNAAASEMNAATSEMNAATSANEAATSEMNAATSEMNAATSEMNAAASEMNAAASEMNAATSEMNAAASAAQADVPTYATRADAVAANIPTARSYIIVSGFAAVGDGGRALYKKVVSEPAHSGKFQSAGGAWWELAEKTLRPEYFGKIGVDATGDTAAWVALVSVANARGGKIKVELIGDLELLGTGTASDSQTFTNFSSLWIKGRDTEVYQHSSLSKTFKFVGAGRTKVTGITFVGYAEQQIDASETPNEIDFDSSSGNAVAAIYAEGLEELDLTRITTRNHAGRDVNCWGVLKLKMRECALVGLGPTYNNPIGDGHQGNGEDAAIYFIPKVTAVSDPTHGTYYDPDTSTAYRAILDVCNCEIKWHSFGIRTILNKAIILHGNYFGTTPGQHCVYDSDSDGHDIVGNVFEGARQSGYKMQYENLAGFSYGKAWQASTAYAVGDVVRAVSIVWVCHTAHTSGGSFSSTNWGQHPRYIRRGGVWSANQFKDCGTGIGIIESSAVDARNIWSEGYNISGNFFENCTSGAMYIDRLWKALITGNNVQGGNYGIFGGNFSGSITKNTFWTQRYNAIALSISKTSDIRGNVFANYGEFGASDDKRVAVLLYAPNGATEPPIRSDAPRVFYNENGHLHMLMDNTTETYDAPGPWLFYFADSRLWMEIVGTWGTSTSRLGRVDGTLGYKYRNHFSGYYNTAQNEPTFTLDYSTDYDLEAASTLSGVRDVLGTYIATARGKRVVR